MKYKLSSILLVGFGLAVTARAQLAVAIAVDPMWPAEAARWATQITQATAAVEQARQLVGQTQTVLSYAGNPRAAINNLADVSAVVRSVGRLTDSTQTADQVANTLNTGGAMANSLNSFRPNLGAMNIFGADVNRDVAIYEGNMALEKVVGTTRKMVEKNRLLQVDLIGKLNDASQRLQAAATQNEIAAAQAEIQRITSMIQAADVAIRNLVEDAKLKKEERELAREAAADAKAEEAKARSLAEALEQEAQRRAFQANVGRALADGQPASADPQMMFQRNILPSAP